MGLNRHLLTEQVTVTEQFSVQVLAVMNEHVTLGESFFALVRKVVFFNLSGRKPSRYSGTAPGREG